VVFNRVDEQFFSAFDVSLLSGRRFGPSDFEAGRNAVIVNRTMAQDLAGAGNPLGRVIRYQARGPRPAAEPRLRYEIVGVVDDLPANVDRRRIYHPLTPGETPQVTLALRTRPTAEATAEGLRETAFALDPALRVSEIVSLDEVYRRIQLSNSFVTVLLGAVVVSVLLLSAAGLYALMSFTVNQRTREIGIRSALGAQPRRLLAGIFRRALGQVGAGAAVGILLAVPLNRFLSTAIEDMRHASIPGVVPMTAVFMIVVGLLAAAGPARRGLRVDPTEALRDG